MSGHSRGWYLGAALIILGIGAIVTGAELRIAELAQPGSPSVPLPFASAPECRYRFQRDSGLGPEYVLPDPTCTPGEVNPDVSEDNIHDTICKPGWTATIRPGVSYTNRLKMDQMRRYGATGRSADYEEDHLIPLELGGSPEDPRNLWPEPGKVPNPKDRIENDLRQRVCSGQVLLADAQQRIRTDWTRALEGIP